MESRSPRSPAFCEKYQSDCMWGLICTFCYHQAQTKQKLLSYWRCGNKNRGGSGYSSKRKILQTDLQGNAQSVNGASYTKEPHLARASKYLAAASSKTLPRKTQWDKTLVKEKRDRVNEKMLIVNAGRASIEKLREEKMLTRHRLRMQIIAAEVGCHCKPFKYGANKRKSQKHLRRPHQGNNELAVKGNQQTSIPLFVEKSSSSLYAAATNNINFGKKRDYNDKHKSLNSAKFNQHHDINILLLEMREAVGSIKDQKLSDKRGCRKNGVCHQSKQFSDAFKSLNSNREVFLKHIQDPNSLFVTRVPDLEHSMPEKEQLKSSSEAKFHASRNSMARCCGVHACNQMYQKKTMQRFLWKNASSRVRGCHNPQTSIQKTASKTSLKSNPYFMSKCSHSSAIQSLNSSTSKFAHAAEFSSFGDIRRTSKHKMAENKEKKHRTSMDGLSYNVLYHLDISGENRNEITAAGINSSRKSTIGDGVPKQLLDKKSRQRQGKPKTLDSSCRNELSTNNECLIRNLHLSAIERLKKRESGLYVEARKHISELLAKGVKDMDLHGKEKPITLGTILSLPEYNFPKLSPTGSREHSFIDGYMAFPHNNFRIVTVNNFLLQNKKKPAFQSSMKENMNATLCTYAERENDQQRNIYSKQNILKKHGPLPEGHDSTFSILNTGDSIDTVNTHSETGIIEHPILDLCLDHQPSVSSFEISSPSNSIVGVLGNPSPESVLDPFSLEDTCSSASTTSRTVELPVQPLKIFSDVDSPVPVVSPLNLSSSSPLESIKFIYEYMRALSQATGLYCNELPEHALNRMLEQSVFDEANSFPTHKYLDSELLCDCINEVLLELNQHYFECCPWISDTEPAVCSVVGWENVVHEVTKRVTWLLQLQTSEPTLEHLAAENVMKWGTWLDVQIDSENVIFEMAEAILEELVWNDFCGLMICSDHLAEWSQIF